MRDRRAAYWDLVGKQRRFGTTCIDGMTAKRGLFKK
jgi:hypothetical protein